MNLHFLDRIQSKLNEFDFFWTINVEKSQNIGITSYNDEVEKIKYSNNMGLSVSLNDFKRKKFFVETINDSFDVKKFIQKLDSSAKKLDSIDINSLNINDNIVNDSFKTDYKINPKDIDFEEKKDLCLNTSSNIDNYNSRFSYIEKIGKKKIINSFGSNVDFNQNRMLINLSLKKRDNNNEIQNYSARRAYQCGYEIVNSVDQMIDEAKNGINDLLVADSINGGKYNVVLDGELNGVFMHEALGHASEADLVLSGDSCLSNSLGKKIAPDHITLHENPTPKSLWGSYQADDDGFSVSDNKIIDNGVMNTFISNLDSKKRLKRDHNISTKLTGNSRRESFGYPTQVRMSNTYLEKGDYSKEELLEEIKNGFYLKGSSGGQVDTSKGTFQFSTDYGYLVENGEIKKPVKNISFGGRTLDVLNSIEKISNKYENGMAGFCGKGGQSVPTGGNNPSVFVKNMLIG